MYIYSLINFNILIIYGIFNNYIFIIGVYMINNVCINFFYNCCIYDK